MSVCFDLLKKDTHTKRMATRTLRYNYPGNQEQFFESSLPFRTSADTSGSLRSRAGGGDGVSIVSDSKPSPAQVSETLVVSPETGSTTTSIGDDLNLHDAVAVPVSWVSALCQRVYALTRCHKQGA